MSYFDPLQIIVFFLCFFFYLKYFTEVINLQVCDCVSIASLSLLSHFNIIISSDACCVCVLEFGQAALPLQSQSALFP